MSLINRYGEEQQLRYGHVLGSWKMYQEDIVALHLQLRKEVQE